MLFLPLFWQILIDPIFDLLIVNLFLHNLYIFAIGFRSEQSPFCNLHPINLKENPLWYLSGCPLMIQQTQTKMVNLKAKMVDHALRKCVICCLGRELCKTSWCLEKDQRSWEYLRSLHNRERFGATPRFLSTFLEQSQPYAAIWDQRVPKADSSFSQKSPNWRWNPIGLQLGTSEAAMSL